MALPKIYHSIELNQLPLQLMPISIRELLFISTAPCDIYGIKDDVFHRTLRKGVFTNKTLLKDLISRGQVHLFVKRRERQLIVESVQKSLLNVTRSLSVGSPMEKGRQMMNLLTINMGYLYNEPTSDQLLKLQHQCSKNFAYFLMNNLSNIEPLVRDFIKQKHHFVLAQPLISSVFVLGMMKYTQQFSEQDIENLFITSYFKDIGMSAIPVEKYDQPHLSETDKELLHNHPEHSIQILKGRLHFSPNHFNVIKSHHAFSLLKNNLTLKPKPNTEEDEMILGFETVLVTAMDIVAAMITGRPFREPTKLFEALELIRGILSQKYPKEFRMIVSFFKNHFTNRP